MLFTTALPQLPAGERRALPADVTRRPAPSDWPFAPLTDRQRAEQAAIERALFDGTLRHLPSIFGTLA